MKVFELGGIDQKTSPLLLPNNKLRDSRNVTLDTNRYYRKRDGYSEVIDLGVDVVIESIAYFKSKNELIILSTFDGGGIFGYSIDTYDATSLVFKKSIYASTTGLTRPEMTLESDEYLDNFYFTFTIDGLNSVVFKYDGQFVYTAGLPTPVASGFSAGTTYYWRVFWRTLDFNGNIVYSPYETFSTNTLVTGFTIQQLTSQGFAGYGKYLDLTSGPNQTIDSSNRTITNVSHNFNPGEWVFLCEDSCVVGGLNITQPANRTFISVEVESVTGTSVTFTATSMADVSFTVSYVVPSGRLPLDGRQTMVAAVSTNATSGFVVYTQNNFMSKNGISFPVTAQPTTFTASNAWSSSGILLESVYDTSTSKLRPPLCKYIKAFGDQLVYGNIIGIWDQNNEFTQFNNNDLIMYSDISTGDSGENISALNRQKIGESFDGEVTGLSRSKDSVIVTKDRSVWSLDGVLVPGEFVLRKIETNYIGCLSNKSILQMDSGFLFQGQDGIYISNGFKAQKFTDALDPFFSTINSSLTVSAINVSGDKYLFYVTDGSDHYICAFDWHWQEWFIWDSLNCSAGLVSTNSNDIVFANGQYVYKFNTAKSDNGAAIDAWIKTKDFDNGEPSLVNKFTELRVYNLANINFSLIVDTFKNWSTLVSGDTKTFIFSGNNSRMNLLPIANNNAVSLKMSNNVLNEDICISGFEFTTKEYSVVDKTR